MERQMRRITERLSAIAATIALAMALTAPSSPQNSDGSLLVTTGWLSTHIGDPGVVVIVVDRTDAAYRAGHVPGARFIPYGSFGQTIDGINLELPSVDSLQHLFEAAGVSSATRVVLTGRPLIVTRAFFTLEYLGLKNISALDGGFTAWKRENRVIEKAAPVFARGRITPATRPEIVARAPWVFAQVGKPGFSIVDTRTDSEYDGTGSRGGLKSTGHVAGARRFEWQDAFTDTNDFSPKSTAELAALWRERAAPGDTVIAYCYIGYRASGSYFISRLLGYPAKLYDGSYEEWARLGYPTVTAATPLRKP
jgi:thiosulfate/3-mercaptopyruvate sulfurtransferase